MAKTRMEVFRPPKGPLDRVFENRMLDWREEGRRLRIITTKYENEYRKKICSKCSIEQQAERRCMRIKIDGKTLTYCNHMNRAKRSKFRKEIDRHILSHPGLFTILMHQKNREAGQAS